MKRMMNDSCSNSAKLNRGKFVALRYHSRAFTSLELLVVIAALAVLTSILLSALAQSKEKDIRVLCLNNEKQLYASLQMYCNDAGDKLPTIQGGTSWPWDIPTSITTPMTNSGCTKKTFYCPSTAPRFTDQLNWAAPNSLWNYGSPASFSIVGYVFALGGLSSKINPLYQNLTLLTEIHQLPPGGTFTDTPDTREVIADVMLSTENILPATSADNFTSVFGGFGQNGVAYTHLSAHVGKGQVPAGGNNAFKDGHVQWRKFDATSTTSSTKIRSITGLTPYFWW